MLYLVVFHAMILMAIIVSIMGAAFLMRGVKIFNLKLRTRNLMYLGACCAMSFGYIGATICLDALIITQWHYVAAATLGVVGIAATIHISVDLSDRLRIVRLSS